MSEPADSSTPLPPPPSSGEPSGAGGGRRLGPIAPVLVAILAAAAVGSIYYFFTRGARGRVLPVAGSSAPRKTGVAILPFPPVAGAEEVAWVGEAAFYFLPMALEDSTELRVLSPERLRDLAKGDLPEAPAAQQDLARRGRADFFLRGEVSGKPGAAHLKASWMEVASGQELESFDVDGVHPDNLGLKLDEIYAHLRQRLRLPPVGSTQPPLASLVPVKEAPTRSYLESSALFTKGDLAGCLKALDAALALSDFHLAHFLQAEVAARAGDPRIAAAAAGRLSKVSRPLPARVTLLTPVILAIYSSGNPRNAVVPLESFLARFPDEKYPLSWLGAIELLLLNEPDRARENLQRSLALDPSNLDAQRLLGQATLASGHAADAVPLLEAYLKSRNEDDATRLLLSDALRQAGRGEDSRRVAQELLIREPENFRAVGILGSLLLEQGKTREAEELYGKLARSRHPAAQAQGELFLGQCSLLQGRFNEGLRQYRSSVQKAAEAGDREAQGRYLLALAEAFSGLNRNSDALATLAEIRGIGSRLDPDLPMINVIVAQKQYDMARKLLQEQVTRWRGRVSASALERLSTSLEGTIALDQGNYREAVKKIEAAAPEPGKDPPDSEALGRAYLGAGEAVRAEAIFRRFTQDPGRFQDPLRYVKSLVRLGEACEKLGKKEEALSLYREALKWWGSADLPLREISDARQGIKRLGG